MKDLHLSAKFSQYLFKRGMLDGLVNAYKTYREEQNYPFELKEKRIMKQAVFKGLCDYYSSQGFNVEITPAEIVKETEKIVKKLWGERPKKTSEKIVKEIEEKLTDKEK